MPGYQVFIGKLISGETPPATFAQLEALLHWLAGRRNHAADMIETAFRSHGVPSNLARRYTLKYLDSSLFSNPNDYYRLFGLQPDCSGAEIRTRHKQLLQIFHPDRHQDQHAWFTARTEQLNSAYAYLRRHHGTQQSHYTPPAGRSARSAAPRSRTKEHATPGLWQVMAANKHRIRQKLKAHLGNPDRFEKRFLIAIYAIPVVLLAFVYLHALGFTEKNVLVNAPEDKETAQYTVVAATVSSSPHDSKNLSAVDSPARGVERVAAESRDGAQSLMQGTQGDSEPTQLPPVYGATIEENATEVETGALPPARNTAGKSGHASDIPVPAQGIRLRSRSVETGLPGGTLLAPPAEKIPNLPNVEQPILASPPFADQSILPENRFEPRRPADFVEAGDQQVDVEHRQGSRSRRRESPRIAAALDRVEQIHAENTNSSHVEIDDTIAVKTLLTQYQIAYNLSSIERMRQLFDRNAVIGKLVGRPAIEDRYLNMFDRTSGRRLVIKDASIHKTRNEWLSVFADYSVNWSYPNGARKAEKGRLIMQVTRQGEQARIRRLEHMAE